MKKNFSFFVFLSLGMIWFMAGSVHAYPTDFVSLRSTFIAGNALANANLSKISTGNIVFWDYTVIATGTNNTPATLDLFDSAQATNTALANWRGFPISTLGQQINVNQEVSSGAYANINGLSAGTTVWIRYQRKSKN